MACIPVSGGTAGTAGTAATAATAASSETAESGAARARGPAQSLEGESRRAFTSNPQQALRVIAQKETLCAFFRAPARASSSLRKCRSACSEAREKYTGMASEAAEKCWGIKETIYEIGARWSRFETEPAASRCALRSSSC